MGEGAHEVEELALGCLDVDVADDLLAADVLVLRVPHEGYVGDLRHDAEEVLDLDVVDGRRLRWP